MGTNGSIVLLGKGHSHAKASNIYRGDAVFTRAG
jgi:uncharacterized phosphosugar-binding protein